MFPKWSAPCWVTRKMQWCQCWDDDRLNKIIAIGQIHEHKVTIKVSNSSKLNGAITTWTL